MFLYFGISAGASPSVSSEKDSRQTAISDNLRSAVSDVFEAQESPGDYAGHYVTFSVGHMSSIGFRQPANKNVPTNPLLGGTVGSRGSSLMTATPKGDLTLIYLA